MERKNKMETKKQKQELKRINNEFFKIVGTNIYLGFQDLDTLERLQYFRALQEKGLDIEHALNHLTIATEMSRILENRREIRAGIKNGI